MNKEIKSTEPFAKQPLTMNCDAVWIPKCITSIKSKSIRVAVDDEVEIDNIKYKVLKITTKFGSLVYTLTLLNLGENPSVRTIQIQ